MNKFIKLGKNELAEQIFKKVKNPCIQTYTILMKGFSKSNDIEKCNELLNSMENGIVKPNIITYNVYLTCVMKCRQLDLAKRVFDQIINKDIVTYSTYIRGLLKLNKF